MLAREREQAPDDGADLDLRQRPPAQLRDQRRRICRHRVPVGGRVAAVVLAQVRDQIARIADRGAAPEVDQLIDHAAREVLDQADVDQHDDAVVAHEHVAGVQVGMDVSVIEAHREERLAQRARHLRDLLGAQPIQRHAVHELHHEHIVRRVLRVDERECHRARAGEVAAEPPVVASLVAQLGLRDDAGDQAPHVADHVGGAGARRQRMHDVGEPEQQPRVAAHPLADAGPQHLDRDLGTITQHRAVDLRDAARRDRHRIELAKPRFDRRAERARDDRAHPAIGKRRDVILERAQLGDHARGEQVRTRACDLADLDKRCSQPRE